MLSNKQSYQRIFTFFLLVSIIFACSQSLEREEKTADAVYEQIKDKSYEHFQNWNIFRREGADFFIFGKRKNDSTLLRLIAYKENDSIWFRLQIPVEAENTKLNSNTDFELAHVMKSFFELDVDKLLYREAEGIEVLLVSKGDHIFLYTFKEQDSLPKNFNTYEKLNKYWYKSVYSKN